MELGDFKFINKDAVIRRRYWIDEIVKLSGHFVNDSSRVENEIKTKLETGGDVNYIDQLYKSTKYARKQHEELLQLAENFSKLGTTTIIPVSVDSVPLKDISAIFSCDTLFPD